MNDNIKYFLIGVVVFLVLMVYLLCFYHKAGAHYQHYPCEDKCEITPTVEVSPTVPVYHCEGDDCVEVTPTEEATPSATPTQAPVRTDISSGLSDGKSDGKSSCPSCTAAPDNYPKSNYDNQVVGWK